MEILKDFGFDPQLLVAQIINFLVVFYLLRRFLYKPVLTMLKNREDTIVQGLKKAEEAQQLLEKTKQEEQKLLQKAQEDARELLTHAEKQAVLLSQKAEEEAKQHVARMIKEAQEQIKQEAQDAQKRVLTHVTKISMDMLQNALSQMADEKLQAEMIKKAKRVMQKHPN